MSDILDVGGEVSAFENPDEMKDCHESTVVLHWVHHQAQYRFRNWKF